MDKKTPLYETHVELGGKVVPFAGYLLPVQYKTGVIKEHMAVRSAAGIFDVSHMAELMLTGPDALANINRLFTRSVTKLGIGEIKYGMFCNERGGVVDDLMVHRCAEERFLLVVNAANHEKDAEWVKSHLTGDVVFEDISEETAEIALQGPASMKILKKFCDEQYIPTGYYSFTEKGVLRAQNGDITAMIARTGYTGEDGFELYCPADRAVDLWRTLMELGGEDGLIPCGLGARDTLRLEAGMPLYGHELTDDITPIEAGLRTFIQLKGHDFIGKDAMLAREPATRRVGLEITGRGIAREHCDIYNKSGVQIGWVSSGTFCPYVNKAVAMAHIAVGENELDTLVDVDVRGRRVEAKIVKPSFYKRNY